MLKRIKALKNQKGFTLVELLAVIVILGIIAAIAIPSIGGIIDKSKADAHKSNALQIIAAAKLAVAGNDVKPGDTVTINDLVTDGYLDSAPKDPDKDTNYDKDSTVTITKNGKTIEYRITLAAEDTATNSITGNKYFNNIEESVLNMESTVASRSN
ncbi:prepilin-type N-terminal cleavage/methylation domain-containing protein [Falsibacillus pallidus]|uniref:prepilin-type N-terminal cleavage/methylation domain-containing protein n=1 Tax=Falsibacillus pallidus TaxID=493781 RepID=UPI003D97A165